MSIFPSQTPVPRSAARLVVPALRWSEERGYGLDEAWVGEALTLGVGGFIFFGGEATAAAAATAELRTRARRPLIFGADLERGAGQQFQGCTPLPPALALASLGPEVVREAARISAREAAALGVRWLYAPVADVALEPDNPIVATRAFGRDPDTAAANVVAWVTGALEAGGAPCLKHFPGHGRTREDSHATLPVVDASAAELRAELAPFEAGLRAGALSVMTAHVAFPALEPDGDGDAGPTRGGPGATAPHMPVPATCSPALVRGLLREEMRFEGVVATDALIMEGIGPTPAQAGVAAVNAGVDVLLYPPDPAAQIAALFAAQESGALSPDRVARARRRLAALVGRFGDPLSTSWSADEHRRQARDWARAVLHVPASPEGPRHWPRLGPEFQLVLVDDDIGGPYAPPERTAFVDGLRASGAVLHDMAASGNVPTLVAVFAEPRGWKGRAGLSDASRESVRAALIDASERAAPAGIILFGDPVLAEQWPAAVPVLCAWGGEPLMQAAAAAEVLARC
jgi:beta-glucosidase